MSTYGSAMPMYGMNGSNMYYGTNTNFNLVDQGKGKGKGREADFEAAFAQVAASLQPAQQETSRIVEVDDGLMDIHEALQNTSLDQENGEQTDFKK